MQFSDSMLSLRFLPSGRVTPAAARRGAIGCALLLTLAPALRADTIWVRSGGAKPFSIPEVRVQKVAGGELTYISENSGNEGHKPIDSISKIKLDDEAPFSAAEEAYDGGDFKGSIDGYRKALDASARPWVKIRAANRLFEAGTKANDLSATVTGFAGLVTNDGAAAANLSVTVPANASKEALAQSITTVKSANTNALQQPQKDLLLNLLARLQTASKDTAAAADTLKKLDKAEEGAPAAPTGGTDAAPASTGNRARGDVKLSEAKLAMTNKNYKQVTETIVGSSSLITEPDQQADALFLLAEAKAATAGTDRTALQDAAIAYMRVVANFRNLTGAPHVAESLLKTGEIEEKLGQTADASRIYQGVIDEYKGSPAAKTAADNAARLGKGK